MKMKMNIKIKIKVNSNHLLNKETLYVFTFLANKIKKGWSRVKIKDHIQSLETIYLRGHFQFLIVLMLLL